MHGLAVDAIPDGPTLLHARARYYDAKHGRWLQQDPKGYVDGPNLYEAFGGNPLANVDPMGTQNGMILGYPADEYVRMHRCIDVEPQSYPLHSGTRNPDSRGTKDCCRSRTRCRFVCLWAVGGIPVTVGVLGTGAYCSYAERNYQFQEMNDRPASADQLACIVFCDTTGISTVWMIGTGDDLFSATYVSPEARVNAGVNLGLAILAGGVTAKNIPNIQTSVLAADRLALESLSRVMPEGRWSQSLILRQGLEIGVREYAAQSAAQAGATAADLYLSGAGKDPGLDVLFGQRRIDPTFSMKQGVPDYLAGRLIPNVAADVRAGMLSPDQLRINAFWDESGQLVSVNNRTLGALSLAGMKPTNVIIVAPSKNQLLRLTENPIIESPLPGPSIPVTPSQSDSIILYVIEVAR